MLDSLMVGVFALFLSQLMVWYEHWTLGSYALFISLGDAFAHEILGVERSSQGTLVFSDVANADVQGGGWLSFDLGVIMAELCLLILQTVQFIARAMASWGVLFSIAIGYLFIPFGLIKQTYGIFESWLKLFCSFLLFTFFINVTLTLLVVIIDSLFSGGYSPNDLNGEVRHFDFTIQINGMREFAGLFVLTIIAVFSTFKSYSYATAISGGLSGGITGAGTLARMALTKGLK